MVVERRYNGPHTCLATSISSDYSKLDYHVISAYIFLMIRADAFVCIKVLQNAMDAYFGFRPTYRNKTVSQIYRDWEKAYDELPRWVFGVYRVSLRDRSCNCEYFQTLHYPCRHAVASIYNGWSQVAKITPARPPCWHDYQKKEMGLMRTGLGIT
ncbi:hypothetical protein Ahy_B08g093086 [Arachis hypogaea]|uniref:SWIM-type domain-containing protein n=1 Tax=Arachis hypogaea TaxID=3818 RepID=A0A444Y551_ARAHY|nr:hypothetical protein Ahy_B08g093086 [Arachis hypogaea]